MKLEGKKIVILVEQQYQDLEVWYPYYRLQEEGAKVAFAGSGTAKHYTGKYGYPATVELNASELRAQDWDAVIVPGGWAPDFLRRHEAVLNFVKSMDEQKKIVAAICHAGWVLASSKILQGRRVTAFSAIKDDVIHAGARYEDVAVVLDGNLITSRTPDDLPAFCQVLIQSLQK